MIYKIFRLSVGDTCNLKCEYCTTREYDNKDYESALKQVESWNISEHDSVTWVANGEPFLNKEFFIKFVELVRSKNEKCPIKIFTNGSIYDEDIFELVLEKNVTIVLSVEFKNEALRKRNFIGGKNVFDTIVNNLIKVKEKYGENKIYRGMSIVYNAESLDYIEETINFYKELGVTTDEMEIMAVNGQDVYIDTIYNYGNDKSYPGLESYIEGKRQSVYKELVSKETAIFFKSTDRKNNIKFILNDEEDITEKILNVSHLLKENKIIIASNGIFDISNAKNIKIYNEENLFINMDVELQAMILNFDRYYARVHYSIKNIKKGV